MKKTTASRTRLIVNILFWLQLAALSFAALAMAAPVVWQNRSKNILVVLDTSASLGAKQGGVPVFDRTRSELMRRLRRKKAGDQVFIVASAPVAAPMEGPRQKLYEISRVLQELSVSHLAGDLSTAAHIGQALMGGVVDSVIVVTDEPAPPEPPEGVEFISFHEPMNNLAIVGVSARGGFCSEAASRLLVTVQSFSEEDVTATVSAYQGRSEIALSEISLESGLRAQITLTLPEAVEGWVHVRLQGGQDALGADNEVAVFVRTHETLPVGVLSEDAVFRKLMGRWLGACQGLTWQEGPPSTEGLWLAVTDETNLELQGLAGILQWRRPPQASARLGYWVVDSDHPVGSYLDTVEIVAASLYDSAIVDLGHEPVVWGLRDGERRPLVLAGEKSGQRVLTVLMDPTASPNSSSLLTLFFNGLRWLMQPSDAIRTGEPLVFSSLPAGTVTVQRPDGSKERIQHEGGPFTYGGTTIAGTYKITAGKNTLTRLVNFLDPLESDLRQRRSTWRQVRQPPLASEESRRTERPLASLLTMLVLGLLLFEWWLYSKRSNSGV